MGDRAARGVDTQTRRVQGNGDALADSRLAPVTSATGPWSFALMGPRWSTFPPAASRSGVSAQARRRRAWRLGTLRNPRLSLEPGFQAPWIRLQTQTVADRQASGMSIFDSFRMSNAR